MNYYYCTNAHTITHSALIACKRGRAVYVTHYVHIYKSVTALVNTRILNINTVCTGKMVLK